MQFTNFFRRSCHGIFWLKPFLCLFLSVGLSGSFAAITGSPKSGFTENKGQLRDQFGHSNENVLYYFHNEGISVALTNKGLSYAFSKKVKNQSEFEESQQQIVWHLVEMQLKEAKIQPQNIGVNLPLPITENHYIGRSEAPFLNIKSFRELTISEIYPGIDWVLKVDEQGTVKYDFVVYPGADPSQIKMVFFGGEEFELSSKEKQLNLYTPMGEVVEGDLYCYLDGAQNIEVTSAYQREGETVAFHLAGYDKRKKLIIDPPLTLRWATCFGRGGGEVTGPRDMAVDGDGNLFVTGYVSSLFFPTVDAANGNHYQGTYAGGRYDCWVSKFSPSRQLIWSTYYGGSVRDEADEIVVDHNGDVFIAGHANSLDFPVFDPGNGAYFQQQQGGPGNYDGFIIQFDRDGRRKWATLYGGDGEDRIEGMVVSPEGEVYCTGRTISNDFPVQNDAQGGFYQGAKRTNFDAFLLRFLPNGQRLWATFYGGNGADMGQDIQVNDLGDVFIAGRTNSAVFPTQDPGPGGFFQPNRSGFSEDAFLVKFDAQNQRKWSTYLGGGGRDQALALVCNGNESVIVSGYTTSDDFPTSFPNDNSYSQPQLVDEDEGFVTEVAADNAAMLWSTYLGGGESERCYSMAVDVDGNLYLGGQTSSEDFPLLDLGYGYYQSLQMGSEDAFIALFNENRELEWSTFYGGMGRDFGTSMTTSDSCVYVLGEVTNGSSPFVLDPGGAAFYQSTIQGNDNGFILQFCGCILPEIQTTEDTTICEGDTIQLFANAGSYPLRWENGEVGDTISLHPEQTSYYSLQAITNAGCVVEDSIRVEVNPMPNLTLTTDTTICLHEELMLSASGGDNYIWSTGEGTSTITVQPLDNTSYGIQAFLDGCESIDSVVVNVNTPPVVEIAGDTIVCLGDSTQLFGSGQGRFLWSTGDTLSAIWIQPNMTSTVVLETEEGACRSRDSILVYVQESLRIALWGDSIICEGDSTTLIVDGLATNFLWSTGDTLSQSTVSPMVTTQYRVEATDEVCNARDSIVVVVNELPVFELFNDTVVCAGDVVSISLDSANSYLWSSGDTTPTITLSAVVDTLLSVTVSQNNCSTTDAAFIAVSPLPQIVFSGDSVVCEGELANLEAMGGDTYSWSTGDTTSVIEFFPVQTSILHLQVQLGMCSSIDSLRVEVTPLPIVNILGGSLACFGETVVLSSTGTGDFQWSNGSTSDSIWLPIVADTLIHLSVENMGCIGSDSLAIRALDNPDVLITGDTAMCMGSSLELNAEGAIQYSWSNGSMGSRVSISPPASEWVWVQGTVGTGCASTDSLFVTVHDMPNANFEFEPSDPGVNQPVYFLNTSNGLSQNWQWQFEEGMIDSLLQHPIYVYNQAGVYEVQLRVQSGFGCSSSIVKSVVVGKQDNLFVPNSFTPNDDQLNDTFMPKWVEGWHEVQLFQVYSRWGELIFETNLASEGWDGSWKTNENRAPTGIYVWRTLYKSASTAKVIEKQGHLTLIR